MTIYFVSKSLLAKDAVFKGRIMDPFEQIDKKLAHLAKAIYVITEPKELQGRWMFADKVHRCSGPSRGISPEQYEAIKSSPPVDAPVDDEFQLIEMDIASIAPPYYSTNKS